MSEPRRRQIAIIVAVLILVPLFVFGVWLTKFLNTWTAANLPVMLSKALDRKVTLNNIRWSLGFDRIGLHASKLDIVGDDNKPFLTADQTYIAVAAYPLLQKKVVVKVVEFKHPVFYAQKISPSQWNCSDIPQREELQHIDRVDVTDGTVHLTDVSTPKYAGYDTVVQKVGASIDRPLGLPFWNFKLNCSVPHKTYDSIFSCDGRGDGPFRAWMNNNYNFKMHAERVNPPDFISVSDQLAYIKGPITADVTAHGVPSKQFSGNFNLLTPGFNCSAGDVKVSDIKIGASPATKSVGKHESPAAAKDSKEKSAIVATTVKNVASTSTTSTAAAQTTSIFAKAEIKHGAVSMPGVPLSPTDFSGKATFDNGLLVLDNIQGKLGKGTFKTSGKLLPGKTIDLAYSGTNIDMQSTRQSLNALKFKVPSIIERPIYGTVKKADLTIKGNFGQTQIALTAVPQNLYCQPPGKGHVFEVTGGTLAATNVSATLTKLQGKISKGTFELGGTIGLKPGAPVDLNYAGKNLEIEDVKTALDSLGISTAAITPAVSGSVEGAVGHVSGSVHQPTVTISLVPRSIIYQPPGSERMIQIVGGRLDIVGPVLRFDHAAGLLGQGKFNLSGTVGLGTNHHINVHFNAQDLDLSHVKVALLELNVHSPLLAEQMLYGQVDKVNLAVAGITDNPKIDMVCVPHDVRYEPIGSTRPVNLQGGEISYKDDVLTLTGVNAKTPRSAFFTNLVIGRLSQPDSFLKLLDVKTHQFDITDLHSYLQAPQTPPAVRDQYLSVLKETQITPVRGKLDGHIILKAPENTGNYTYQCNVVLDDAAVTAWGLPVDDLHGRLRTEGEKLHFEDVNGKLGASAFHANGMLSDYNDADNAAWDVDVSSKVHPHNLLAMLYEKGAPVNIKTNKLVDFSAHISGAGDQRQAKFTASIDPDADFELQAGGGDIVKPKGEAVKVAGSVNLLSTSITVPDVKIQAGSNLIDLKGTYDFPDGKEPQVDFTMDIPELIHAGNVLSFVQINGRPIGQQEIGGELKGHLHLKGAASKPAVMGFVEFSDVKLPDYKVEHLTGRIGSKNWLTTSTTEPAKVNLSSVTLSGVALQNVSGQFAATPNNDGFTLNNITSKVAGGTLSVNGTVKEEPQSDLTFKVQGVDANKLCTQLFNAPNEITGTMDGDAKVSFKLNAPDIVKSANATVNIAAKNGKVTRFGTLQKGINALNLLKSGFLDFNLNNLISTVVPFQSGEFDTFSTTINMTQGKAEIHHLRYVGKDLLLRAHGTSNVEKQTVDVACAGNIPRVNKSGPLGFVAPYLGVGGLTQVFSLIPEALTGAKLSSSAPRAFSFNVKGSLDKPQEITQSVTKSFRWLPNQPTATAHPAVSVQDNTSNSTAPYAPGALPASAKPAAAPSSTQSEKPATPSSTTSTAPPAPASPAVAPSVTPTATPPATPAASPPAAPVAPAVLPPATPLATPSSTPAGTGN
ncbi:MAG TPA: AsmA-like C-terminal region-containing protein [Planktothrix sp.]|jgi:hypothetical protein